MSRFPVILFTFLIFSITHFASAQVETDFAGGGALRVGDSTTTCDASIEGAIRFDADGTDTIDYCNGSAWLTLLTSSVNSVLRDADGNTQIQVEESANDDIIRFDTAGTQRMVIAANGNVGVNAGDAPFAQFQVSGWSFISNNSSNTYSSGNFQENLQLRNYSIADDLYSGHKFRLYNANSVSQFGFMGAVSAAGAGNYSPALIFAHTVGGTAAGNITERMRVHTDGNVGIGTNAPAVELDVHTGVINAASICDENNANCIDLSSGAGSGDFLANGSVPMTGELELASDSDATTPELTFNGDENTGIYNPAPDNLGFVTAGTEAMAINASGQVGIGGAPSTFSPLVVRGQLETRGQIWLANGDGQQIYSTDDNITIAADTDNDGTGNLFNVRGNGFTEYLVIDNDGEVGIGTSNPLDDLHVWGTIRVADETNGNGIHIDASDRSISFQKGSASDYDPASTSDDVPFSNIRIGSNSSSTGRGNFISFRSRGGGNDQHSYIGSISNASGDTPDIVIGQQTGGSAYTERMRIDENGNVGLGTTSPAEILHISESNTDSATRLRVVNSAPGDMGSLDETTELNLRPSNDFTGGVSLIAGRDNGYTSVGAADAFFAIHVAQNNVETEKVRVTDSGYVGIGTTSPQDELHVWGTTRISTSGANNGVYLEPGAPSVEIRDGSLDSYNPASTTAHSPSFGVLIRGISGSVGGGKFLNFQVNPSATTQRAYIGSIASSATYTPEIVFGQQTGATAYTEAMRIDDNGRVGIGTTSPGYALSVSDNRATNPVAEFENASTNTDADGIVIEIGPNSNPGTSNHFIRFLDGNGTEVGKVQGDGAGGVSYNTTSDRRIKRNIRNTAWGIEDLMKIRVADYNPIGSDLEVTGYIAQELYEVYPQVVTPAEDTDELWTVNYSKMTPLLTKSVQDLYGICQATEGDRRRMNALSLQNKRDIASLKKENQELNQRVQKLEALMKKILRNKK